MSEALPAARKFTNQLASWSGTAQDQNSRIIYGNMADAFATLINDYERLQIASRPVPESYGDLSDLPPTLRRELAGLRTDELDDQIYMIVSAAEHGADLDTILIELWRRFRVEQTRRFVQNKSYRLWQKRIIFPVAGRKGLYAASQEAARRLSPSGAAPAALPAPGPDFDSDGDAGMAAASPPRDNVHPRGDYREPDPEVDLIG